MNDKKRKRLTFKQWINEIGVANLAEMLGVDQSAVRHWRLGNAVPRVEQMRNIKKLSNGRITYDIIIDG